MMTKERTLGPTETRLLNRLAANGQIVFSTDQARAALGDTEQNVNKLLYRLTRKRWLLRLEKGKYLLLPLEAGSEGTYTIHEFVIAAHLVEPYAIAYASAFSFHDLFDLLPQTVLVATTRRKDDVVVDDLGLRFRFVTLTPHKFFGFQTLTIEDHPVQITRPSKTLVDGLDRPDLCGGIVGVTKGIYRYARDYGEWERVTADAQRLGNRTVFKRLGYLVELTEVQVGEWLERWRAEISAGETLLDPRYGRQGDYHSGWNLRLNVSEEALLEWRRH
jgi:predicted transcriptional regulator of viral defense system